MTPSSTRKRIVTILTGILPAAALTLYLVGAPTQTVSAASDKCTTLQGVDTSPGSTQACVYSCHGNGDVCTGTQSCKDNGTWAACQ
jgi:hypothetical protein